MISLKIIYNDGEKESLVFNQSSITIGRSSDNDVSLITAHGVSRHHAKLYREGDTLILEDLNSTNGSYINSQKVSKSAVSSKDVIEIGSVCIKAVISNLAENPAVVLKEEQVSVVSPVETLKQMLGEAYLKINERNVEKVIIRSNSRVKFIEQGQEVELGVVYTDDVLFKLVQVLSIGRASNSLRIKIDNSIICSVLAPPLVNDGVCICIEKISSEDYSLEDYLSQNVLCRDSERMITEAYIKGKNIIFAGLDRKAVHGVMLALAEEKDSRVCILDRFARLRAPKNGMSFSASSTSDLIEAAQFANSVGINRFFVDEVEHYSKSGLSTFAGIFPKGGVGFVQAANIKKLHSKIADLSGFGADFWCHVLVWFEGSGETTTVKSIFKAANTDSGLELVEIFSAD